MQPPYTYEILPLETPDDDPRWAAYVDVFRFTLLDTRRATAEGTATFRSHRRADRAVLGMVTAEGPGLDGRVPVAAYNAADNTINCGRGLTPVLIVNTVGVLPSHRRRGLLKAMMREQLDAAVERGVPLATLTASEATIYGRYGFGIASRGQEVEIDPRKFAFRPGTEVADGPVEFVAPSFLEPHWEAILTAYEKATMGAVGFQEPHRIVDTGAWSGEHQGPNPNLRAVVHFDESGTPDGFATFEHKGWGTTPVTSAVGRVVAADVAVRRALWLALTSMDLVERLTFGGTQAGDPVWLSLVDPRAVAVKEYADWQWLRILDLPAAARTRRFDGEGSVTVAVDDQMGYCQGTWLLSASGGEGTVEATEGDAELRLDVDTLAMLWLGDRSAGELAAAGRITGDAEAVRRFGRLMRTDEPAANLAWY